MKTAIFMFEKSGNMASVFAENGWHCLCIDIENEPRVEKCGAGEIKYINADARYWKPEPKFRNPDFFVAWVPCDHTAVSGARWFKGKGLRKLVWSIELLATASEWADTFDCPSFIENPVSTFATYWREPDYTFHPCDYTLFELGDSYTKKTCLWVSGGFIMPKPAPHPEAPEPDDRIHKAKPGAGRKDFRSETPMGFCRAVYDANFKN